MEAVTAAARSTAVDAHVNTGSIVVEVVVVVVVVLVVVVVASSFVLTLSLGGLSEYLPLMATGIVPELKGSIAMP